MRVLGFTKRVFSTPCLVAAFALAWGVGSQAQESSYKGLSLGLVAGFMNYHEPSPVNMREYGLMQGLNVGFFKLNDPGDVAYNISADLLAGQLKYDGGSVDLTTNATKRFTVPTNDWMIDARATIGAFRSLSRSVFVTPYIGAGYRVLNDKAFGAGGYGRNISYLYLPLGVSMSAWIDDRFSVSLSADWEPAYGIVISRFSDVDSSNPDITNHDTGSGYRLQMAFRYDMGSYSLHVTPFYQKWQMDDSDRVPIKYLDSNGQQKDAYLLEPKNQNDYVGANFGVDF